MIISTAAANSDENCFAICIQRSSVRTDSMATIQSIHRLKTSLF